MNQKHTRLWRRLGSIAGLGLALACAFVLAGSAAAVPLSAQRSFDASADLSISVNHQPEPAKAYDVVGFHMLITNPSDFVAEGVGITVDAPPSNWIAGCTPTPGGTTGYQIYCPVRNIDPNSTVPVDLSLRVHPDRGDLTATVASANDPNQSNNSATDQVSILPRFGGPGHRRPRHPRSGARR